MRIHARALLWVVPLVAIARLVGAAEDIRLAQAAKNRNEEAVRTLITQKADVNAPLPDGATALHWAAQWNDLAIANLLVGAGARADAADEYGVTPLWLAAINGSPQMTLALLNARANPNRTGPAGETVLMRAARSGSIDTVRHLLDRGANINAAEPERGQTALMWAAAEGYKEVVRLLIDRGADPRTRSKSGFTPLLFAAQKADRETVRVLLDKGITIDEPGGNGTTALVVAATNGHTAFSQFLLDLGADANAGPGFAPLHVVAQREEPLISDDGGPEKLDFVRLLLARGANPNARATRQPRGIGSIGATPFFLAAWAADTALMRLLVEHGADPSIPAEAGTTALMAAAGILHSAGGENTHEKDAFEAVKLCVELGNDVNAANVSHGDTALHGAAYRGLMGSTSIIQFLVEKGADINAVNKRGWTPLLIAEGLYFSAGNTKHDPNAELLRKLGAKPSPPEFERNAGIRSGEIWYEPGKEPARLRAAH